MAVGPGEREEENCTLREEEKLLPERKFPGAVFLMGRIEPADNVLIHGISF